MRFSQGWNVLWNSDGDKYPFIRLWINSPLFSWGNKSSYCNLVLDGVHHRQMHLDEFWHFFPCTLSTRACMGVRPCLFSSLSCHTHHLPLQGNSSSLTQLMGAARRLMTSTWREPVTPLLLPSPSPTLFVCGNKCCCSSPAHLQGRFVPLCFSVKGKRAEREERGHEPFLTIITKHLHRKTRTLAISIGEKGL